MTKKTYSRFEHIDRDLCCRCLTAFTLAVGRSVGTSVANVGGTVGIHVGIKLGGAVGVKVG